MSKYNGKFWVSELSDNAQKKLVKKYKKLLKDDYSKEDVEFYVSDLINEKLGNIEDTVGANYLKKLSNE